VAAGSDEELTRDIQEYVDEIIETVEPLGNQGNSASGAEFGILWLGLEADYGVYMDRSRTLRSVYESELADTFGERLDDLIEAFQLFATGKEYFKTLYYTQEVSQLSRTLLVISLPSILVTASAILAINSQLLPEMWVFGLPPLMSFVATVFTIALAPFLVLTAYMLSGSRRLPSGPPGRALLSATVMAVTGFVEINFSDTMLTETLDR